ncbi:hypothetical protein [Nocardioides sp.]|nr:hypothetical protein [Nocardioides sp.]MDP3892241.1 hypothetical protein [Nocardioides sp.]
MTTRPADDYSELPPTLPLEETVAHHLEGEERFGGPGGADSVDGDGD